MDKEKQIEEMAEDLAGRDSCKHLPKDLCNNRKCSLCEAEILYEAGYRKQEWISVEERLPDENGFFLVNMINHFGLDFVTMASYSKVNGWVLPEITHWMPLPEAPKMRKEDEGK